MPTPPGGRWFAVATLALVACASPAPADLPVGVLALMSGQLTQASGVPTIQGAQLALELDSADGRVRLGDRLFRVRLVIREHEDRPDAATTAARALITHDSVIAIIGPQLSRHAIPAAIVAENARLPLISPMSSAPATTAGLAWVFRLAHLDDALGRALARFAREDLGARRAAVLYEVSSTYAQQVARVFAGTFTAAGGRLVAEETFTTDAAERPEQLARIARAAADVVLLPNFPADVARQIPALRAAGVRAVLLGGDTWDVQTLAGVPEAQGSYMAHNWRFDVPLAESARFVARFRERFGVEPRATAAMTFDAMSILLDALRRAASEDPEALRAAIAATAAFRGATGMITFAGRHDPERSVAISALDSGRARTLRLFEP